MVKHTKASPGKRFCKNCKNLIPIHSRVCSFCNTPQYTIQQIAKEYKKRLKVSNTNNLDTLRKALRVDNPLMTSQWPDFICEEGFAKDFVSTVTKKVEVNGSLKSIACLEAKEFQDIQIFNVGGRVNSMQWAFREGKKQYLALSVVDYQDQPVYGEVYEGPGLIQVWTFDKKLKFHYGIKHAGKYVFDIKWLPSYCNSKDFIGVLAVCLGNGTIEILKPFCNSFGEVIKLAPLENYFIQDLVFNCLEWVPPYNRLAAGSQDGSIILFGSGNQLLSIYNAHNLPVTSLVWSRENECLASCSLDGLLKLWDKKGHLLDSLCSSKRWSYHLCTNLQGNYLFFDNDGSNSPHKVVKVKNKRFENKKHVNVSTEATVCTCFSSMSSYAYIASVEGHVAAIYLSELEKSFKKRKSPWSRFCKVMTQEVGNTIKINTSQHQAPPSGLKTCFSLKNAVWKVDLAIYGDRDLLAWGGEVCGVMLTQLEEV